MATLAGSTIASTYDRLLILPAGGGSTTTLKAVTDGDAGTTFAMQLSTTTICIDNPTADSSTQGGILQLQSDDNAALQSGSRLGVLQFYGSEASGGVVDSNVVLGAKIEAFADTGWGASENGTDLVFTTVNGTTASEKMRITAEGFVGIGVGTNDPDHIVEISHTDNTTISADNIRDNNCGGIHIDHTADTNGGGSVIKFSSNSDGCMSAIAHIQVDGNSADLAFFTDNAGGDLTEAMRIDDSQHVCIGNNSPDGTLHVHSATAGNWAPHGDMDDLVVENSANVGVTLACPDASTAYLAFSSLERTGDITGQIACEYNTGTDRMSLGTNGNVGTLFLLGGKVGIGIAAPATGLHVTGGITATRANVSTLGDGGEIPITVSCANIDAGGVARTEIIFAGTGTAGQIIFVNNTGGEALTFNNAEGTSLVRGIAAAHDTMPANFMGMFVSDGALWNLIAGGIDTQPDVGLTAS